jgi:uncharacterized RDD family membrane protein YckC
MTQSGNPTPQQPMSPPPAGGWAPPPAPAVGPAGLVYADVPNRIFAIIIDGIILGIVNYVFQIIVYSIFGTSLLGVTISVSILGLLILVILDLAASIAYFTYTWSTMRASLGMRALGMQIGDATTGATLTMNQALRRALVLWGPSAVGQFLLLAGGFLFSGGGAILSLIGFLLAVAWPLYLLYTTSQSPTKQGYHDVFAHTMVVKAARTVA